MENVVRDVGFQNAGKQNGLHGDQAGREWEVETSKAEHVFRPIESSTVNAALEGARF